MFGVDVRNNVKILEKMIKGVRREIVDKAIDITQDSRI